MISLLLQQYLNSSRSVYSSLRIFCHSLAVSTLVGTIILRFGFVDLEYFAVEIVMALGSKSKKKKGLVATLSHKTVKKVQSSLWQTLETKTKKTSLSKSSKDTVEPDSMRVLSEHEDSFATSPTNLNASLRSNSSGSYVTAFCDSFGSDEMLKVMSSSVYNSEETNKELLRQSKRQGSFDADSGNGGSPPPLQHVGIDTTDLEVNNRTAISALLQQELQEGSVRVLDKRSRSVQTILRELQSKSVSDDVKARNLASLNRVILQCKEYMQRYSVRQDLMSLGLFNALPSLIESGNREVESELEIFFASESNDNLVGTGSRHPIDTFQAAYVKLKHSASADILLDILELIARIEPSGKRLRGVLHYLQRGHLRSEGVQTEAAMENKASSFCDIVASQNVSKSIITAAQDNLVLKESSSVLQTIRRPRSSSRMKRCSGNRKIEVENIPFIDDETSVVAPHMNLDKTNGGKSPKLTMSPKSTHSRPSIKKQSLGKTPTVPTVPPPPPPPPPAPEFLNSALSRQTSISTTAGSPVIVKSVSVYKKKCATNTVAWETIKPEMVVTRSTIWSDQSGIYAEFNQRERDRLEKVFERVHASNSRVTASQDRAQNVTVDRKAGSATTGGFTEKRALNLGIVLARFRPLTLEQLIQKLESFSISDLSLDYLSSLLKHFPTPDELAYFAKMKTADHLKDAELFCFLVARKSLLRLRIELKVLADNIVTDLARQLDSTRLLLTATDGLYNSPSINVFFHRCLQYGNFLNQSTFAAGASGFALSSLLAALNTKGTGAASSIRLVDVLAEYADENLRSVVKVLDFLDSAKKYSIDELEKSEASLRCSLEMSLKSLQECGDSKLYSYYSPVIMDSIAKCGQLSRSIKKVRHNENRLKEYYCAPKLCLENILEILSSAIKLFQDSLVKAEARVARAQRLQKQRVSAGRDTTDIHECRRRKNDRTRIFAPPNVKDLIDIINSNECR